MNKAEKIKELLTRGVQEVIIKESLAKKLSSGRKLRVKLGVDPTSPLMHLGHTVVLRKLRQFQDLGHTVIFLVGDFTARVGDPSDKLAARKPLTDKEIRQNVKTYKEQVGKVLDLSQVEFRYNMEWYKDMDLAELIQLASLFSVNQILERDMFQKRIQMKRPVWIHELLYPVLQGYDSVALRADVELGGTDQTFNMLTARTIQPSYNQAPQDIMTAQLLEGPKSKEKMSKSLGNAINLDDLPQDMYGKVMSIDDTQIMKYFRLLTDVPEADIKKFESAILAGNNPMDYKSRLAHELVSMYYDKSRATIVEKEFSRVHKERKGAGSIDEDVNFKGDIVEFAGSTGTATVLVSDLFKRSKSEVRRLIQQGAIRRNGVVIEDPNEEAEPGTYSIGRREFKSATFSKPRDLTTHALLNSIIKIKNKNNSFIIKIIKTSKKKEIIANRPKWSVEYKVIDDRDVEVGFGHFSISCSTDHRHLDDDQMFTKLAKIGAFKVQEGINTEQSMESVGYNIHVDDCCQ